MTLMYCPCCGVHEKVEIAMGGWIRTCHTCGDLAAFCNAENDHSVGENSLWHYTWDGSAQVLKGHEIDCSHRKENTPL
jgi:hypothetical protein